MMRYFSLLFIAILAVAITGCKKESRVSNSLTGTWELYMDVNGFTGHATYHKAGNDTLAVFTETTYSFFDGSKLVKSGTYYVKKDTSFLFNRLSNRIIFDGNTVSTREFFDIQNNQLSFWLDANDAGSSTYKRVR
ncbi:MAG: hypothetical protein JSU01_10205 [Bacteroidetes bacterium]|nr:hypothetical protein [Bacteroidota bacterium]